LQVSGAEFRLKSSFLHSVHVNDVPCNIEVVFITLLIDNYKEGIKSTHDRRRNVNIVVKRASPIVSAMNRVGSGQDRSTSIQGGMDTGLSDRDSLLLHGFVDGSLISWVHLIELIDAADTVVGEHKGSRFNTEFSSLTVFTDTGSQTSSRTCLSTSIDSTR
jgi:hypothetical protein